MQDKGARRTNAERREATRNALLNAARALFVEKGYAETGTPEIVATAQVTRGALYHHFADKADLFRAVVEQEFAAVADEIERGSEATETPKAALIAGAKAYMAAMQVPGRVRLMLLDGPAVLGQAEIERIDQGNAAGSLRAGLEAAMQAGTMRRLPLEALTAQLSALFDRAALEISTGQPPGDHLAVIEAIFTSLASGPDA